MLRAQSRALLMTRIAVLFDRLCRATRDPPICLLSELHPPCHLPSSCPHWPFDNHQTNSVPNDTYYPRHFPWMSPGHGHVGGIWQLLRLGESEGASVPGRLAGCQAYSNCCHLPAATLVLRRVSLILRKQVTAVGMGLRGKTLSFLI